MQDIHNFRQEESGVNTAATLSETPFGPRCERLGRADNNDDGRFGSSSGVDNGELGNGNGSEEPRCIQRVLSEGSQMARQSEQSLLHCCVALTDLRRSYSTEIARPNTYTTKYPIRGCRSSFYAYFNTTLLQTISKPSICSTVSCKPSSTHHKKLHG